MLVAQHQYNILLGQGAQLIVKILSLVIYSLTFIVKKRIINKKKKSSYLINKCILISFTAIMSSGVTESLFWCMCVCVWGGGGGRGAYLHLGRLGMAS